MNGPRAVWRRLLLPSALAVTAFASTQNPNPTVLTVKRGDTTMVITNSGLSTAGARNLLGRRGCEAETLMSVLYGPPDEVEMVIDGDTTLRSSMVTIREPEGEQEEESGDQQTIEMVDGQATFSDRPSCLAAFSEAEQPLVLLEQGRTTISATRFFLDREVDVAQLDGPIELERAPEGDSDALHATSESLAYDLETELSTLTGNVRVESGDRISEAERLELDEEAGLATLTGTPARSVQGEDEIEGDTLLYYLDSNDVVVLGRVQGTLEVDLD